MDDRLLEAIRGGSAVVTAGRRLARHLRQDYDAIQQSAGLLAWPAPMIISLAGWLDNLWQEDFYPQADPPILLSEWQERILWESVIDESGEAAQLLQKRATATAALEAWSLATAWRLNFDRIEQLGGEDARTFVLWAQTFRERCSTHNWLDEASLPDYLRGRVDVLRLPEHLVLAGFDEIAPQQQDFLDACKLTGCAVERLGYAPQPGEGAVRVAFADARVEIAAAARWSRTLLQSGVTGRIAIVVPDLESRRDQVVRIFRFRVAGEPSAFSPAQPFRRSFTLCLPCGPRRATDPRTRFGANSVGRGQRIVAQRIFGGCRYGAIGSRAS